MKILTFLPVLPLLALAATALPAQAATSIGVSIGINAPGQYGRIDINNYPQPVLVMQQPVIYAPTPQSSYQRAVYLYAPPAHQAQWGRYCGSYRACGQPVYFVREDWVRNEHRREYEQRQASRGRHGDDGGDRGERGDDRDGQRGSGKGHGHNGRGNGKHGN